MENPSSETPQATEKSEVVGFQEFTGDRMRVWKQDMGDGKFSRVTGEYSDQPGYKKEVFGSGFMTETWENGSRRTGVNSEKVNVELEQNGHSSRITTQITANSMYQETTCPYGVVKEDTQTPLIPGQEKFFAAASTLTLPYQGRFHEELSIRIGDDGKKVTDRHFLLAGNDERLSGPGSRYRLSLVSAQNGVIRRGIGEHGVSIGYTPPMEIVK